MRDSFLPFAPPLIGEEEISEVVDTLRSGWITTGPKVHRFEDQFGEYVSAPAALAVSSGTAAMHLALVALGIGEGDEVITTPMTFSSTVHVIEHVGARPVLVDVDPATLNISPELVASAVTSSTRAVLPVHLYGQPCDLASLSSLGVPIIEDAAHSLPAAVNGHLIGSQNLVAFSFYATKNLTTGEGGMLTGPPELIEKARVWSLHGMSHDAYDRYTERGSWYYEVVAPGFKYNMTDIQASLGVAQLARLDAMAERRREIAARYSAGLSDLDAIQVPVEVPGTRHAWHIYAIRLRLDQLTIDRSRFIDELRARKIGSSVHFIPIHLHPYYRDRYGWTPADFPVASAEYERLVSIPIYPSMTDEDVDDVIEAVTDIAKSFALEAG